MQSLLWLQLQIRLVGTLRTLPAPSARSIVRNVAATGRAVLVEKVIHRPTLMWKYGIAVDNFGNCTWKRHNFALGKD